ncbi:MAG TPA: hypothetical protein PLL19_03170 [Thiobacillaceae bacterium]|nr:hypothetical protein [Thiobacillaceae bacterium]HNA81816.1 hypothetical protein [Thiobacillaceae bacterium]HNF88305.1 hypothetical protein [Thiobacillaceae bacterium]HNH88624.1 hypothetical protein [Thiobacillaceae bacterium]HNI06769.1 hypothetical protein [Thiobacillaceae bacterium]
MRAPVFEAPARLGWRLRHGEIMFDPELPIVTYALTPIFPMCADRLAERRIVWNLWALMDSARRPGGHDILTCECGQPPHARLEESVLVSHPDDESVVWELDIQGLKPALAEVPTDLEGFVRLVFRRPDYEADIRAMLREVGRVQGSSIPVAGLMEVRGQDFLVENHPEFRHVVADLFEPTVRGDYDGEALARLDAEAEWPREPLFPPGTRVEIGLFGGELCLVDGRASRLWIERWFTRWTVLDAYRQWGESFARAYALPKLYPGMKAPTGVTDNEFVLLPGGDMKSCHRAGEAFKAALQRAFLEGSTAPGVSVGYRRLDLPGVP